MTEREQLKGAIATLEAQHTVLGDAVVDTSIAALRDKLAALEPSPPPTNNASRSPSSLPTSLALRPCQRQWTPKM